MLNKLKKSDAKGFTIIEVMIVLAIAGLILLIVFLAVPALQRNARNTQRKNDASAVAGAIANFISNNGGSLPISLGSDLNTNTLDLCSSGGGTTGGTTACTANTNLETAKMGYYTQNQIYYNAGAAQGGITVAAVGSESTTKVTTNSMVIDKGYTCNSTNTDIGAANQRSALILYVTETGSGNGALQCVEQ